MTITAPTELSCYAELYYKIAKMQGFDIKITFCQAFRLIWTQYTTNTKIDTSSTQTTMRVLD